MVMAQFHYGQFVHETQIAIYDSSKLETIQQLIYPSSLDATICVFITSSLALQSEFFQVLILPQISVRVLAAAAIAVMVATLLRSVGRSSSRQSSRHARIHSS